MNVLSGPSEGVRHPNPYVKTLLGGLSEIVDLETFRWRHALFRRYDIIHLHWPEHAVDGRTAIRRWLKTLAFAAVVLRAKLVGTKLVWTVHNDTPHERQQLSVELAFWLWQRSVDGAIFLTEAGRANYSSPRVPTVDVVIHHGHYGPSLPDEEDILPAPSENADRPFLVSFGLLRPYKGLDQLIQATAESEADFDLVVAGQPRHPEHLQHLRRMAGATPRVRLDARYVPQLELVSLIRASTGVVLPYVRMNNSGALMMALTLGRPVLVPDSQTSREIAELVGPGWIHFFSGSLRPRHLDQFFATTRQRPATPPDLRAFEWDDVIAAHEELYRKLVE